MHILGINPSIDAAVSLVTENDLLYSISEERFKRIKHIRTFPVNALQFCLKSINKKISDIDVIAVCWNPGINIENLSALQGSNYRNYSELLIHIPYNLLKEFNSNKNNISSNPLSYTKQEFYLKENTNPLQVYYINHHISHCAQAFFLSQFEHSAILSMDGYGEETSVLLAHGKGNKIIPIKEILFPNSLGSLYAAITQYLGFTPNQDEGIIMGLAAWGKPKYYSKFKKIIKFTSAGLELDLNYFSFYMERRFRISNKFIQEFGLPRLSNEEITEHHKNIAASLQKIVSEIILEITKLLYKLTNEKNLCISGGVALNCAGNGSLFNKTPFKNIFIPSAPGDDGNSLGAALYLKHVIMKYPKQNYDEKVYLGHSFNDEEIKKMLISNQLDFIDCVQPEITAAKLLAENKIIGWFQGRMEFGPRALGNRSILAHPGGENIKQRLDQKIKFRASFRPYAPAILKEKYTLYFKDNFDSPYMSFCAQIHNNKKNEIMNVVHKDGSARVQMVEKKTNQLFYNLIKEFEKLTKIPLILNTSLNSFGEPIVNTPQEALKLFFTTDLDALFLGKILLLKK